MTSPSERLVALTLELCRHVCVTGGEGPIADAIAARYRRERVRRQGNSLVVGQARGDRPLVALVGHTDVVPPTPSDAEPRVDGDLIIGRGTSDMKAGLAVAMDCFEDPSLREGGVYDLLLVAYAGEEGPHEANELGQVLASCPDVAAADLAVVLEPTDLTVQLGCQGTLHGEVTITGRAAHSARPWLGENALTKAAAFLVELGARQPQDVEVEGLVYREVVTATAAHTHNARNVVPDRVTVNVNYRFAPDKDLDAAAAALTDLVGDVGGLEIVDAAPAARPYAERPLVQAFVDRVGATVQAKQAWTDVARFSELGVPALNYGPGVVAQAHQAGEHVPVANLVDARRRLAAFLAG